MGGGGENSHTYRDLSTRDRTMDTIMPVFHLETSPGLSLQTYLIDFKGYLVPY